MYIVSHVFWANLLRRPQSFISHLQLMLFFTRFLKCSWKSVSLGWATDVMWACVTFSLIGTWSYIMILGSDNTGSCVNFLQKHSSFSQVWRACSRSAVTHVPQLCNLIALDLNLIITPHRELLKGWSANVVTSRGLSSNGYKHAHTFDDCHQLWCFKAC